MPSYTVQVAHLPLEGPRLGLYYALTRAAEAAVRSAQHQVPAPVGGVALIDTGASNCAIDSSVVRALGLQPVSVTWVDTLTGTNVPRYQYPVRLVFPDQADYEMVATEATLAPQGVQCLIGRDLLVRGGLFYNGVQSQYTLFLLL